MKNEDEWDELLDLIIYAIAAGTVVLFFLLIVAQLVS